MAISITLNSGTVLTLSEDQETALTAYLGHPQNQVPYFNPVSEVTTSVPRWASVDDWVVYHWSKLLGPVLELCPPLAVSTIQDQIAALQAARLAAAQLVAQGQ
jgi:hypothetical protein